AKAMIAPATFIVTVAEAIAIRGRARPRGCPGFAWFTMDSLMIFLLANEALWLPYEVRRLALRACDSERRHVGHPATTAIALVLRAFWMLDDGRVLRWVLVGDA